MLSMETYVQAIHLCLYSVLNPEGTTLHLTYLSSIRSLQYEGKLSAVLGVLQQLSVCTEASKAVYPIKCVYLIKSFGNF